MITLYDMCKRNNSALRKELIAANQRIKELESERDCIREQCEERMKKFVCVHHDTMDGLCHGCAEKILNISGVEERVDEELAAANQRIKELERERDELQERTQKGIDDLAELASKEGVRAEKAEQRLAKLANFNPNWDMLESTQKSLREHMKITKEAVERAEKAEAERDEAIATKQLLEQKAVETISTIKICHCEERDSIWERCAEIINSQKKLEGSIMSTILDRCIELIRTEREKWRK